MVEISISHRGGGWYFWRVELDSLAKRSETSIPGSCSLSAWSILPPNIRNTKNTPRHTHAHIRKPSLHRWYYSSLEAQI